MLLRVAGPGNEAALERSMEALSAIGFGDSPAPTERVVDGDSVFVKGEGWFLHVTNEGSSVRFWSSKRNLQRASHGQPYEEVVQIAKTALKNELGPLVPLGANEELVAQGRYYGMLNTETTDGLVTDEVVESVVHFGRSVGGVAVVGPGSRAVVMLDNDGRVVGFDLDWSEYVPTEVVQPTVPISDVNARVTTLEERGALAPERRLEYVECGYYDGGTVADPFTQLIQPGCVYRFTLLSDGEGVHTVDVAVPAGTTYTKEDGWMESVILADAN